MQPDSPLLRTYQELVARVMLVVGGAFDSSTARSSDPVGQAARRWRAVPSLLQQVHDALAILGQDVFGIVTDVNLSDRGRDSTLQRVTRAAQADITTATNDVLQRIETILTTLRAAAFPARPAGDIATQEAQLAGIKADLRMVLDPTTADPRFGGNVLLEMQRLLDRALGTDEQLTAWLLASSNWPIDYLASRGVDPTATRLWNGYVAQSLDAATPTDLAETRRVYTKLADAQTGLPVLRVLFASTLPQILDQITTWRTTSTSTAPPAPPVDLPARSDRTTYR